MSTSAKKSALNWLMAEYDYKYSPELAGMAKCVQAYSDYVQSFESDVSQKALREIMKQLEEITGLSPNVGYTVQALLKREVAQ